MRGLARATIGLVGLTLSGCVGYDEGSAGQGVYAAPGGYPGPGYYSGPYNQGPPVVYGSPGFYDAGPPGFYGGRDRDFHEHHEERFHNEDRRDDRGSFHPEHQEGQRMSAPRPMAPAAPPPRQLTAQPPSAPPAGQNQRRVDQLGFRPN